jgi:HlyD family secretion protein
MRRALTAIGIIVLIGAIGYLVYFWGNARSAASVKDLETVVVNKGDIAATVAATGKVAPKKEINLAFESGGKVADIMVEEGDEVEEGQSLVQLDTQELQEQVAQARASLEGAEARLDQILEQSQSESKKQEIIVAKANLERARLALEQAQSNYDKISWLPQVSAMPQAFALQQAYIDYDSSLASYNLATAGPSEAQIRAAQADVDQARANANLASLRFKKATLVAPFSGVVTSIAAKEGELVNPGSSVVRMIDPSGYHIDLSLDETDIPQVKEGQEANILLDALPDWQIKGQVEDISPSFRLGMTAEVTIITQRKEGILILPSRALQFNRDTGRAYVEKMEGDNIVTIDVETGLTDDFNTEIVSGLKEGDVVVIRGISSLDRLRKSVMFTSEGGNQ